LFQLRRETLDFLTRAPKRWAFEAWIPAPVEVVFDAISADPSTWRWFPGFSSGRYESAPPYGVGTIRRIRVRAGVYRETIIAWDRPTRWAYRVDTTSAPIAKALVEEWALRDDAGGSVVRWTFAIDPRALFRLSLPAAPAVMNRLFRKAMSNLSGRLVSR